MDLLTVKQAAAVLGLSARGVLERIERGDLLAERAGARLWLIPRAEVERQQREGRRKPGRVPTVPAPADGEHPSSLTSSRADQTVWEDRAQTPLAQRVLAVSRALAGYGPFPCAADVLREARDEQDAAL